MDDEENPPVIDEAPGQVDESAQELNEIEEQQPEEM
jgi:hypothetical protein